MKNNSLSKNDYVNLLIAFLSWILPDIPIIMKILICISLLMISVIDKFNHIKELRYTLMIFSSFIIATGQLIGIDYTNHSDESIYELIYLLHVDILSYALIVGLPCIVIIYISRNDSFFKDSMYCMTYVFIFTGIMWFVRRSVGGRGILELLSGMYFPATRIAAIVEDRYRYNPEILNKVFFLIASWVQVVQFQLICYQIKKIR